MKKILAYLGALVSILILSAFIYGITRYIQAHPEIQEVKSQSPNYNNQPITNTEKSITKFQIPITKSHHKSQISTPSINDIVVAICLWESDNRRWLRGDDGERGIMQIKREVWNFTCHRLLHVDWTFDMAFNRAKNITVGRAYLKYLIRKYGDWHLAVRIYNAGYHGVTVHNRANKYLANIKHVIKTGDTKWRH